MPSNCRSSAGSCTRSSTASRPTTRPTASCAGARRARTRRCTPAGRPSSGSTSRTSSRRCGEPRVRDLPHSGLPGGGRPLPDRALTTVVPRDRVGGAAAPRRPSWRRGTRGSAGGSRRRTFRQGAPTSPALASLAATELDRRLAALARHWPRPTRATPTTSRSPARAYLPRADAAPRRRARSRATRASAVAQAKTRVLPLARAPARLRRRGQRAPERRPARVRPLKAILHDAAVNGPAAANRTGVPDFRAHLLGRDLVGRVAEPRSRRPAARAARRGSTGRPPAVSLWP